VEKLDIEEVSLKLGPSYSTTTSRRRITFWLENVTALKLLETPDRIEAESSPETKYAMASVRSFSERMENSSPSSSV
jgi:hypothetical protein